MYKGGPCTLPPGLTPFPDFSSHQVAVVNVSASKTPVSMFSGLLEKILKATSNALGHVLFGGVIVPQDWFEGVNLLSGEWLATIHWSLVGQ